MTSQSLSNPSISVIMPVYNSERYLPAAIESILNQTFTDFEFLIHDDGSTDRSLRIAREYADRDSRIVVSSSENRGIVPSLNTMIDCARAPLLARMDADDICRPERFALQVEYLSKHPKCDVVGGGWRLIDEEGRPIAETRAPADHMTIESKHLQGHVSMHHPSVMVRTAAVRKLGAYSTDFPHAQDYDLWLRMAEHGELANIQDIVLDYRVHDNSVSATKADIQHQCIQKAFDDMCKRRGIEAEIEIEPWRMGSDRASRTEFYVDYGWRSWASGYRNTWWRYAVMAVVTSPWSSDAWKLLILGYLKRR